jgi:FKBP-type peptidyl-prolyl cis-trans isomerase 2
MTENEGAKKHHEKKESAEEKVGIEAGDIVLAEFEGWIVDPEELFDTTDEALAKEKEIFDEKMVYGAQPLIVGKQRLFPGLDEDMLKAEVGKEYEVQIAPEKGAGPRDPKLVELHPVREFLKQEIEPRVGLEVTVRNRTAIITAVTAGRVRLDFNNKLAGRNLRYKYKIVEKATKPKQQVELVLKMAYGTNEGFEVEHHGKNYKITLPDACKYDQKWTIAKYRVVSDLRDVVGAEEISFVEHYAKPEKKDSAESESKAKPEEPKAEEKPKAAEESTVEPEKKE